MSIATSVLLMLGAWGPIDADTVPVARLGARTVSVTFVNLTGESGPLFITGPAGEALIGSLGFRGRLTVQIPIHDSRMPVTVGWQVGRASGEFTITPDTFGFLRIDLTQAGAIGPYPMKGPVR